RLPWAFSVFGFLFGRRFRGGNHAYLIESGIECTDRWSEWRNRRSHGSLFPFVSEGASFNISALNYLFHILVVTSMDRSGILVSDPIPERGGDQHRLFNSINSRCGGVGARRGIRCGYGAYQNLSPEAGESVWNLVTRITLDDTGGACGG